MKTTPSAKYKTDATFVQLSDLLSIFLHKFAQSSQSGCFLLAVLLMLLYCIVLYCMAAMTRFSPCFQCFLPFSFCYVDCFVRYGDAWFSVLISSSFYYISILLDLLSTHVG